MFATVTTGKSYGSGTLNQLDLKPTPRESLAATPQLHTQAHPSNSNYILHIIISISRNKVYQHKLYGSVSLISKRIVCKFFLIYSYNTFSIPGNITCLEFAAF